MENLITNYDSLHTLMAEVNKQFAIFGVSERVDGSLVHLCDALAYGRASALHPAGPYRLLKFSRSNQGKLKATLAQKLPEKGQTVSLLVTGV